MTNKLLNLFYFCQPIIEKTSIGFANVLVNNHNHWGVNWIGGFKKLVSQPAITCLKLTVETLEQGVKYVQSWQ